MRVDTSYVTSLRLPEQSAVLLKRYAANHGWSVCRAVREAVKVAVEIDEAAIRKVREPNAAA